ncbi:MAG: S-methyl-5'-thioadenosine phosphorylase [Candidatus Aenigmarchaeota archaeon]|nr:S-methyl-5'-thioadenosine phosphorylase [Candidatus Aenigmarchaeota archaeon]
MESAEIGIIGGTAVFDVSLLEGKKEIKVSTPYGSPSDCLTIGTFRGRKIAILPRHGKGHTIPPHRINTRANIHALKQLGVSRIFALAAVGSLKEDYKAGEVVIPDQFIDWGKQAHTFYDEGKFYHGSMADPFCPEVNRLLVSTARSLKIPVHEKGTYVRIEGPQFSTRSASRMYRQFGDIIGMTCIPEAILAREKEICLSVIATVTDYDVWAEKPVSYEEIRAVMKKNTENTEKILETVIPKIPGERKCICKDALKGAEA